MAGEGFYTIRTEPEARNIIGIIRSGKANYHDFKALEIYSQLYEEAFAGLGITQAEIDGYFSVLRVEALKEAKAIRNRMRDGVSKLGDRSRLMRLISDYRITLRELRERSKKSFVETLRTDSASVAEQVFRSLVTGCRRLYEREMIFDECLREARISKADFLTGKNVSEERWNVFLQLRYVGEVKRLTAALEKDGYRDKDGNLKEALERAKERIQELED